MPPAQVGPEALHALGAALGSLRDRARSGADEVLDHLPEVGDRELQTVLDDHLEQVAALLREVESSAADVSGRLRVAAARRAASIAAAPPESDPGSSSPAGRATPGPGAAAVDPGSSVRRRR